jgi:hypothetical protein
MILNRKPPKKFIMHKFLISRKTKRFWIVVSILIVGIMGIFSSAALARVQEFGNHTTYITGRDIVDGDYPLVVVNTATSSENTWGRVIRVTGNNAVIVPPYNINSYFDIGVDDQGNFFINSPVDTKTSHSLMISRDGVVTINRPQL